MELDKSKIISIYQKLSIELISNIIKSIERTGDISSFTRSQIKTMSKIGGKSIFLENLKASKSILEPQKKAILEIFEQQQKEIIKQSKNEYEYRELPLELSKEQVQILNTAVKRTDKKLKNMTRTIAFRSKQIYTEALNYTYMKVITGAFDYTSSVKDTVNKLTEQGFTLKSKGREYKLESAVKMNLRTSLTQTANYVSKQVGKEIDADGVWIGPTSSCRPSHRPINGVKMTNKQFKKYEYLTEEPNCQHIVMPIIIDIFKEPYNKSELKSLKEYSENTYEQQQKANYYARQVRQKKSEIAELNKSDKRKIENQELLEKKKKELSNAQNKYRTYCKSNGLEIDYDKTWVSGYNK